MAAQGGKALLPHLVAFWGMKFGLFSANPGTRPRQEDVLELRLTPGWSLPGAGMLAPGGVR